MNYVIVFIGAGVGGAMRHGVNVMVPRLVGGSFPYHTVVVNVVGCLIMGLIAEYFALKGNLPAEWRLFLTTGILGGFTTFSAFSLDAVLLYERGQVGAAAIYVAGSVLASLAGLVIGLRLVRSLIGAA